MSHRFLTSIMSLWLLSCGGSSTPVPETAASTRSASSSGASKPPAADARKVATASTGKAEAEAPRDAKTAASEDEDFPVQDFSGVDTTAPKDDPNADGPHEVAVQGIKGTTSQYDVRSTLEARNADFDLCHDRVGGSGGRLVFRIHIEANGDVGGVKVTRMKVRNTKLVECYTEVVTSSHFPLPHGGYADVKWTTKVGRSRKRPQDLFARKVRWDAPSGTQRSASGKARKPRNGA